jgi:radical SAM protein with 4Fe4S-binding SPASM domain
MEFPPVIRIEPASACNLRCTHCPTGVVEMPRTVMKKKIFSRIISELKRHIPPVRVVVLYHGGEPFLNKYFLSMIKEVKELGIPLVKTVSNGMLIKPADIDDITNSGLDQLEISLDGESFDENNSIRRRSDGKYVIDIIKKIIEGTIKNKSDMKLCVASTQFQYLDRYIPGQKAKPPKYIVDELKQYEKHIEYKSTWAMMWPSNQPAEGYDVLIDDSSDYAPSCNLIEDTLSIRADGNVVPCCFDLTSEAILGNIIEEDLIDIWNGYSYNKFRSDFNNLNYPELCKKCVFVTGDMYLLKKIKNNGQQDIYKTSELLK